MIMAYASFNANTSETIYWICSWRCGAIHLGLISYRPLLVLMKIQERLVYIPDLQLGVKSNPSAFELKSAAAARARGRVPSLAPRPVPRAMATPLATRLATPRRVHLTSSNRNTSSNTLSNTCWVWALRFSKEVSHTSMSAL